MRIEKGRHNNKYTIMVIEDEVSLCDILSDELTALGYRVVIAHNGEDGLRKIGEHEPDLIICDRAMPAMTGSELIERLRGMYPQYSDVPFIFLTALTEQKDKDAVARFQPTAYLEKPLDFDVLSRTIRKALN